MPLISLTRLRLASPRYLPGFVLYAIRSSSQARRSPGYQKMRLLADRQLTFWTATAWDDLASMKGYRNAGSHRLAMKYLAGWCDEASVIRWLGPLESLDDWDAAYRRMIAEGEPSHVRRPSPQQLTRSWAPPRTRQRAF